MPQLAQERAKLYWLLPLRFRLRVVAPAVRYADQSAKQKYKHQRDSPKFAFNSKFLG